VAAWLPQIVTLAGVAVTGLATVYGAHLVSKRNAKSADRVADAAVQTAINAGFETLMGGFTTQLDSAKSEIVELRGWIRELIQHMESLEEILRGQEIPVPPRRHRPHLLALVPKDG